MRNELTFGEWLVAEVVTRALYFLGAAIGTPILTALGIALLGRGAHEANGAVFQKTVVSQFPTSPYWLGVTVFAIIAAFVGPMIFSQEEELGRGALAQIKHGEGVGRLRDMD